MYGWYKMFINLAITLYLFIYSLALEDKMLKDNKSEIDNCDCDVLQINDPDGLMGYQNFTKQNGLYQDGKPYFFSIQQNMIISYNNYWYYNKYSADLKLYKPIKIEALKLFSFENMCKNATRKLEWKGRSIFVNSQCLRHNSNCLATKELTRNFVNGNHLKEVKLQAKNPCKFPFIYKNVTYESCTKMDRDKFWCAAIVDDTNHLTSWGYCNDLCPQDNQDDRNRYIIIDRPSGGYNFCEINKCI